MSLLGPLDRRQFLRGLAGCALVAVPACGGAPRPTHGDGPGPGGDAALGPAARPTARCVACGTCAALCPEGALDVTPGRIACQDALCSRCGDCARCCPVAGIILPTAAV